MENYLWNFALILFDYKKNFFFFLIIILGIILMILLITLYEVKVIYKWVSRAVEFSFLKCDHQPTHSCNRCRLQSYSSETLRVQSSIKRLGGPLARYSALSPLRFIAKRPFGQVAISWPTEINDSLRV